MPFSACRRASAISVKIVRFGGWFRSGAATGIVALVDAFAGGLGVTGGDWFGGAVLPAGVAELDQGAGPFMLASGLAEFGDGARGAAGVGSVAMSLDELVCAVATGSTAVSVEEFGRPLEVAGGGGVGDDFGCGWPSGSVAPVGEGVS